MCFSYARRGLPRTNDSLTKGDSEVWNKLCGQRVFRFLEGIMWVGYFFGSERVGVNYHGRGKCFVTRASNVRVGRFTCYLVMERFCSEKGA